MNQCPQHPRWFPIYLYLCEPLCSLWQKKAKNGVVWDKFGVVLAHFGVVWAQFGVVWDNFGNKKTPKNRIFNTKNPENKEFPIKKIYPVFYLANFGIIL